jgi:hypothetical protein
VILRTLLLLALGALVLLAFLPRPDARQIEARMQRRAAAFRIALRQTLYGTAAALLAAATAFGLWHWLRHDDRVALAAAAVAAPGALLLAWMCWRVGARPR